MPGLIIYATRADGEFIRKWINAACEVAWIEKIRQEGCIYEWKATQEIGPLQQQQYALWHVESGPLNIPSGGIGAADTLVDDPFNGWIQKLDHAGATRPWFGGNLPGPYSFTFAEDGCEARGNLARSEFSWLGDRYKAIGKPAHPAARSWWRKLQRFVERSSTAVPWVDSLSNRKVIPMAYVFPDAARQIANGRQRDVNPWIPKLAAALIASS
ncbi:MAG: hypothetical protein ING66_12975 [Rhodocyclaceae bacterium]|nr:hypothetical protein [Rhodocyclaceae bacterium]MCA3023861.1 hypothetical protein [Rhodocyclaceae bacterium]MCA3029491.1 hypothetical protein [Rhodocyclaceae bacterium]MCA3033440.1 hypothetical protein [Rhodocyclaceae bacterium]MCA3038323.1 hypothetical protein [Rhodocyclaceae bacterium]